MLAQRNDLDAFRNKGIFMFFLAKFYSSVNL